MRGDETDFYVGQKVLAIKKVSNEWTEAVVLNNIQDGDNELKLVWSEGQGAGETGWQVPGNIKPLVPTINCDNLTIVTEEYPLLPGDIIIRNIPFVGNTADVDMVPLLVLDVTPNYVSCFHLLDRNQISLTPEYLYTQGKTYFLQNMDIVFSGFEYKV